MTGPEAVVWLDGRILPAAEAKIPVMSHALHYGTAVFEGVRSYQGDGGTALFRTDDHLRRFVRSAAAYGMTLPVPLAAVRQAMHDVVNACGSGDVYVRPLVFRGAGSMSLDPDGSAVEFAVAGWRLDDYFGADVAGIDATIATWARISPGSLVPRAKAAGHYLNSILAKADAHRRGFHEAILLDERGLVCEASAMNVFAVHSGCLTTPEAGPQLLEGITRDTVCRLASDVGADLVEGPLTVDGLRSADELLLTGTGARIVPVRRLDDRVFGQPGALTAALIERFDDVTRGRLRQHRQWLDPVAETRSGGRSWTSV